MHYLYLMENIKPLNEKIILAHVNHLKQLDESEKLTLCGPFVDYPGGMVILQAESLEDAIALVRQDPFIAEGYKSYQIRTVSVANKENHYGLV